MTAKKMGRPAVDTHPVTIRMSTEMIEAIDEARRVERDLPTRPEVIRRVMEDWLKKGGFLKSEQG